MAAPEKQTPGGGQASANSNSDSVAIIGADVHAGKRVANLKAALALRGFQVHDSTTGGWLVARWDLSHYCARIEDLEAFLRRVGGAS
ncbi:hypothetical protein [Variovorax rhizosphaerae]|uniref:Uncharacterized protein n=1 Tax=Variovorax rhizosphaerae TaxID=1836200 RepID=A0ABU8WFU6_9BURK